MSTQQIFITINIPETTSTKLGYQQANHNFGVPVQVRQVDDKPTSNGQQPGADKEEASCLSPPRESSPPPADPTSDVFQNFGIEPPHAGYKNLPHYEDASSGRLVSFDTLWSSWNDLDDARRAYERISACQCPECPPPPSFDDYILSAALPQSGTRLYGQITARLANNLRSRAV